MQALEGVAGAGKTTALTAVREAAERDGYVVQGLAPTGRAAQQLAGAGMPTSTLQRHLVAPPPATGERRLYVLDESSLASTRQMHAFLARLGPSDRVLLVGDARQHQAVDAGRPYEQLQDAGLAVARLSDIKRQQDPHLKGVVERLSVGDVRAALARLDEQGRVHTIADRRERLAAVAVEYLARPSGTLVIAPDNQSREQLNARIRQQLQAAGHVAPTEHKMTVLVPRQDLTGPDRGWAGRYVPGDIVRYARGSTAHQLTAGAYARVSAVDADRNLLTVTRGDGESVTYDPRRLQGVMVYREAERAFAVGDRIQFTAPFPAAKVANREMGRITAITNRHEVRVRTDAGKTVAFGVDMDSRRLPGNQHVDHGYAVTSHSSQGLTDDRSLLYIDSERSGEQLVNQRLAYVALSRGRHDAQVYSDLDLDRLVYALSRDVSKSSASSARHEPKRNAPHVERQQFRHARQQAFGPDRKEVAQAQTTIRGASPKSPAEAMHPADRAFSVQELRQASAYLELPPVRAVLQSRDTVNSAGSRQHQAASRQPHEPASAPPIEARHVAAVLRTLPRDAPDRYTTDIDIHRIKQTPAMIVRAAGAVARAERVTGNAQLAVEQPQPMAGQHRAPETGVQRSAGPAIGQGRS